MVIVSQTSQETKLKSFPDLSRHCLQQRLDLAYRLWLLLRPSHNGRGWVTLDDIYRLSCGSKRQTRAWLRAGLGVFWTRDRKDVYRLAGLGVLCRQLDVRLPRDPVYISLKDVQDLGTFRAALFASWFVDAGDEGRIISQAALGDLFGRTSRTLRTWGKTAGLVIIANLGQAPIPKPGDDLTHYPTGTLEAMRWGKTWLDDPHQKVNLVWFERQDDKTVLTWKIPNAYVCTLTAGPKTSLQKRASRRAPSLRGVGANTRRYYGKDSDGRTLARAIESGGPVYLETGIKHDRTGERLWERLA